MTNWIFIDNKGINLDHVTDVRFYPATSGTDDETGKTFKTEARLEFWLTSTEIEQRTEYDGAVNGTAAVSRCHGIIGTAAEDTWQELQQRFVAVSQHGKKMIFTTKETATDEQI